jgi:hypothetical protein
MDRAIRSFRWYWPEFLNAGTVEPGWYVIRFKIETPTIGLALCGPLDRSQAHVFARQLNKSHNGGRR